MKFLWFSHIPTIKRTALSCLYVLTALAVFCARRLPAQEESQTEAPATSEGRALDPLATDERASAERIARSDKRVKELLGEAGIRVVSIEPIVLKLKSPKEMEPTVRSVEVVLFRPGGEVGARAIVDLRQKAVAEVERLKSSQVPMTADDLQDAFQLALRDSEVQKMLGGEAQSFKVQGAPGEPNPSSPENLVTGLPLRSTDPKDPCSKHRCLELFFRQGTDFVSGPSVVADLTAKRVYIERRKPQ